MADRILVMPRCVSAMGSDDAACAVLDHLQVLQDCGDVRYRSLFESGVILVRDQKIGIHIVSERTMRRNYSMRFNLEGGTVILRIHPRLLWNAESIRVFGGEILKVLRRGLEVATTEQHEYQTLYST